MSLTANDLRKMLNYDEHTGLFSWRISLNRRLKAGDAAGTREHDGYYRVGIRGRRYKAHRLAWLYVHGVWPSKMIDHADGNPSNNAISNLREAGHSQNNWNKAKRHSNTSGFKGVRWHKRDKRWIAEIRARGKWHHLGTFPSPETAAAAYADAAKRLHGEFAKP